MPGRAAAIRERRASRPGLCQLSKNEAFQVVRFRHAEQHGMIAALHAFLEHRHVRLRVDGRLVDDLGEQRLVDVVRTAAGVERAAAVEQLQRAQIDLLVAGAGIGNGGLILGKHGKPINIGGSRGRREATGRGVMVVCDEACHKLGLSPASTRVIVQGFGNVGSNAALLMHQSGYKVIGIGEVGGGLYNKNGIDLKALVDFRQKNGTIHGFPGAEKRETADLLVEDCEILIPAATENVITSRNADRVKCRILAEGANGPTTSAADDILADKGVFVIPDILANAGGVTTSYFEWVQDRQGYFWKESVVNEQLDAIMKSSFEDVVRYAETHHVNNRIAAYMLAIDRVAYTIRQRGIYA